MKKLFIISAILLVVVLIFLGIYNFAFRKNIPINENKTIETENLQTNNNISVKTEKITTISNGPAISPTVNKKTEKVLTIEKKFSILVLTISYYYA